MEEDNFLEFLDKNKSVFSENMINSEVKLTMFDFLRLHSLFVHIDTTILSSLNTLSAALGREDILSKYRDTVDRNKREVDDYFISILKRTLEQDNVGK